MVPSFTLSPRSRKAGSAHFISIFPWTPPENLPLSVLQKMRIRLLTVFYESITTYVQSVPSHQTSPAGSVYDFPKILLVPTDLDGFE